MIKFALKAKWFDSQTQNIFCYDKIFINICSKLELCTFCCNNKQDKIQHYNIKRQEEKYFSEYYIERKIQVNCIMNYNYNINSINTNDIYTTYYNKMVIL